jgi:hypothetical protein
MVAIWLFAIVIGITAIAIGISIVKAKHRARQMERAAARAGLAYQSDGSGLLSEGLSEVPLFLLAGIGRQSQIDNVLTGNVAGTPIHVCDYSYWTGSVNKTRFDYNQTVACFPAGPDRLPGFTLHPQNSSLSQAAMNLTRDTAGVLAGVAAPMAGQGLHRQVLKAILSQGQESNIEIPECPRFSGNYQLLGSDRESIRRLFRPPLTDRLLELASPISVECAGGWLVFYRKKLLVKPDDLPQFMNEAAELRRLLR